MVEAGAQPLPLDRLVTVRAGYKTWLGRLCEEEIWEDDTRSYKWWWAPFKKQIRLTGN